MRTLTSADFRRDYSTLTEPVVVTANRRTLGTWLPGEALTAGGALDRIDELEAEVARLKRELAQRPSIKPYPGPVETNSTVPDPLVVSDVRSDAPWTKDNPGWAAVEQARRARQATIDATLGKMNRKKERA